MRMQFVDLLRDLGFVDENRGASLQDLDAHAKEFPLVRAVVCAGLFPKVAAVRNAKHKAKWHTRDDGKVDPHPSSVNARETQFEYKWMVYNEKVKSAGGTYVRDSTNVSDLALLLFGGPSQHAGSSLTMLDGYVQLETSARTTKLVTELRRQLDVVLEHRLADPAKGGGADSDKLQR